MEIRKLGKEETTEFRSLVQIFKEVFELEIEIPSNEHLRALLQKPDFFVVAVFLEGNVVGGLSIYVLHRYYSEKPIAYIYDVGISPEYQGKGIGKKLMEETCKLCKLMGFEEAYVEAESEDIDAVEFYRRTEFNSEMEARHFTYVLESPISR
jgi:aminoglycoside 3-N-acetyltransferase I